MNNLFHFINTLFSLQFDHLKQGPVLELYHELQRSHYGLALSDVPEQSRAHVTILSGPSTAGKHTTGLTVPTSAGRSLSQGSNTSCGSVETVVPSTMRPARSTSTIVEAIDNLRISEAMELPEGEDIQMKEEKDNLKVTRFVIPEVTIRSASPELEEYEYDADHEEHPDGMASAIRGHSRRPTLRSCKGRKGSPHPSRMQHPDYFSKWGQFTWL